MTADDLKSLHGLSLRFGQVAATAELLASDGELPCLVADTFDNIAQTLKELVRVLDRIGHRYSYDDPD